MCHASGPARLAMGPSTRFTFPTGQNTTSLMSTTLITIVVSRGAS